MTDTTNVISLRTGMPRAEPLESSEYSLTVGDDNYRVRRAVDRDTQRGFVTIVDEAGKALLVFSSSFPDEHVSQLIVGWRAGHKQGLDRGRLDGIEIGIARGLVTGLNDMLRRRGGLPFDVENVP